MRLRKEMLGHDLLEILTAVCRIYRAFMLCDLNIKWESLLRVVLNRTAASILHPS